VLGGDGALLYANRAVLEHYGWTTEYVQTSRVERLLRDIAHPDDVETSLASFERGFAGGSEWDAEVRTRRRDGVHRCFLVRASPLRDDAGHIARWYITATDIDDRKKAEDKIRQQKRELREIVDIVPHHIAIATPDGTSVYGNHVMLDYYGPTLEGVQDTDIGVRRFMHPDDIEPYLATWERGFAEGATWETEGRFRRRDGEYRWFLVRGTPLRDGEGRILRWYVTGTDIDDRKKAEDKVRQDERELRMVLDFVPEIVIEVDVHGRVLYANQAGLAFTGLTLQQATSNPDVWPEVVHPDDLPAVRATIRGLAGGKWRDGQVRLRRRDGQYRWMLVHFAQLLDDEGRVVHWYAAGTDIDDSKRAEERAREENVALREEVDKASMFEEIVGTSPRLKTVRTSISRVAPSDSTVLITGETGTGKELVARAIHKRSKRQARAFVSVNCAAIPPTLIASELFGHEKGAFTGALARRLGRFELADGGTLFLDEIGDLPLDTQVALLRVLQEGEFERVGSTRSIHVDLRVIAATNRDLKAAVTSGAFRADLFYRLNVFPIEVPPLRERMSDIPLLVSYFVDRYARKTGKTIRHVDEYTLELIQAYRWPGNVRELQNVIERAIIVCDTDMLVVEESWLPRESLPTQPPILPLGDALVARERELIEAALAESKGKVSGPSGAAARLGIPASTLDSKISALKIRKEQFKGT
jgi:formate hydrogenlyase transcriptional activator